MPHSSSFSIKKPVSVWNQPLKADVKGLFSSLAKIGFHGFTGQWTELGIDAAEGLTALGIERDAHQLSWLLIRRSLFAAMSELVSERAPLTVEPSPSDLEDLSRRLDGVLETVDVTIDRSLFENPRGLALLAELREPFSEWLRVFGLTKAEGDSMASRLPSYFVLALHHEWRRNAATYEAIHAAVDTPFTAAAERERAWALYAAHLQRQVDEPMFGEAFGLRQVYVPLRAFYVEEPERESLQGNVGQQREQRRFAVNLEQEIDRWLKQTSKTDSWRILSGGPGSGKSSFGKMYAAKLAAEGQRVLFIPLHQFNVSGSLPASVGELVRNAEILPYNPLEDATKETLLIIFDGLDELSQQGHLAAEVARDFLREVQKTVGLRNHQSRRLLVLITGREPVVQANASELRDKRLILHALPYLALGDQGWQAGQDIVTEDQRQAWWRLYGEASGKGYTGLPQELSRPDLDEITAQPLLNYLVALSHVRGRLDFSQDLNLNHIYEDLLEAVHDRTYEGRRQHRAIQGMELKEFVRVLEEIALAAWHGNGRTTTVAEIEEHCRAANLSGLLERFAEGAKAGVTRVLTAFYFREFGRTSSGDRTFEFTHKSFREYLTALRIVRAVQRMESELERQQQSFDSGWSEREALRHWAEICGPNPMDYELFRFVRNQVRRAGVDAATRWQHMLCRLISVMLRTGIPMELLSPRPAYQVETRQARNAEEALLAFLNACAQETKKLSRIEWSGAGRGSAEQEQREIGDADRAIAGAWISRLRGQRDGPESGLALKCLSYLDLAGCILHICDLYGADLSFASLAQAGLVFANLRSANLHGADLQGAILQEADLQEADLQGANLREASLQEANLKGAKLKGAKLQGAKLQGAELQRANLDEDALAETIGTPRNSPLQQKQQ